MLIKLIWIWIYVLYDLSYIIVKSANIEQKMKIEEKKKLILEIMERQIAESK